MGPCELAELEYRKMKKYIDPDTGRHIVETEELSFLRERNHRYGWLQRHIRHHRLRIALKKADIVIVPDPVTSDDIHRFYFIPREKIIINRKA